VKVRSSGAVMTVSLDSPPVNAIGESALAALEDVLETLQRPESEVRVLVFTGEGRYFGAGADLQLVRTHIESPTGGDDMVAFVQRLQNAYATIAALPIPTICAMNGTALGGGFELALACDLRIAASDASYGLPEIKLGLLPGAGGTQRLTRIGGRALAFRLALRGETVSGSQAEQFGLVHWALPTSEVAAFAAELADELASRSPMALAAIKRCIQLDDSREGYELEIETTRLLMDDPNAREGLKKFFARDN
jgi:enoyl-CoA hydratase